MIDEQIDQLGSLAGQQLGEAICEMRDDIKTAELAIYEETQENDDAKPKLSLGFSISVNLLNRNVETKLTLSIKHALKGNLQLSDPSQPEFPIDSKSSKPRGRKTLALTNGHDSKEGDNGDTDHGPKKLRGKRQAFLPPNNNPESE